MGIDRFKFETKLPLPTNIDPSVSMMHVEEKPDVTYKDILLAE